MKPPTLLRDVRRALPLVGCLVLLAGCGCGRESGRTIVYADGTAVDGEYQSSPVEGPWLHFPGGRRYQLVHHLGATPSRYEAYLGFEEWPADSTTGSGNGARFHEINDEYLVVENDTCASFYLRVVASVSAASTR